MSVSSLTDPGGTVPVDRSRGLGGVTNRLATDVALGGAFLLAIVVEIVALADSWGVRYWLFGGAAAVVVCLLALLRRWHRAWLAAAGLTVAALTVLVARLAHLPAEPGPAMALALAVLVGAAVRTLPRVPAGAVAAGGLGIVVGSQIAALPAPGIAPVTSLAGLAWLTAVAVGLSLRLVDVRRQATVEKIRQDERLELARELHDVVTHHITGIVLQAQAAQLVAGRQPEKVPGTLAGIESAGSEALAAMRRVVGLLRDAADAELASPGGTEQLSALVDRFTRQGPPARLRMPERTDDWPPEVASTVYRIVQEALTNVARHAPHARAVTVTVEQHDAEVTVQVVDDASPAPARYGHRGGYGLVGMRERVESLGGDLRVGPRSAGGWSVLATLPLPTRTNR
ncbi:Signal transduction histidine kinase [Micromonospora pallida]|uniref:histidine kinase n=1 Tax=Micromonospora pallida TaxID=145854 RepID=A0A1C6RX07_9ACTN|nr:histidine kinase [Micromonospora pallida]SCL21749.1 Signal transduction histidine kinase [Micromonospora pallida]